MIGKLDGYITAIIQEPKPLDLIIEEYSDREWVIL